MSRTTSDFYVAGRVVTAGWNASAIGGEYLSACLLYTSDAADERSSVDLGGRRIIKKKTTEKNTTRQDKIQDKDR